MKTETKITRTFEEGDIIVSLQYNWIAIRTAIPGERWTHSNAGHNFPDSYDDAWANKSLDIRT